MLVAFRGRCQSSRLHIYIVNEIGSLDVTCYEHWTSQWSLPDPTQDHLKIISGGYSLVIVCSFKPQDGFWYVQSSVVICLPHSYTVTQELGVIKTYQVHKLPPKCHTDKVYVPPIAQLGTSTKVQKYIICTLIVQGPCLYVHCTLILKQCLSMKVIMYVLVCYKYHQLLIQ